MCPSKGHHHGVSIESLINLGKTFSEYLACELSHRPNSWRGFMFIYLLSFPRFWTLCVDWFPFLFFDGVIVKIQNSINRVFFLYIVMYRYYYRVKKTRTKTKQKEKARLNVLGRELNNHTSIWGLLLNKEQFYESDTSCSSTGVFNRKTVHVSQR